ncbi:MAG TPA: polyprenyl synthetase family protein [Firmicutes bacterium]|nr:polyprenyl synthetase family protein [Bacillota bacterium]
MTHSPVEREALRRILAPVAEELVAVERLLHGLAAEGGGNDWLGTTVSVLLDAGGKRLRPALVLLCARTGPAGTEAALPAAAAVELLHLASLVHDDVIDHGTLRRGLPTVNSRWGDALAILTGDFLFGKAMVVASGLPPGVVRQIGEVIGVLVGGEVEQQLSRDQPLETGAYLRRIQRKTAALVAAACRIGATLGGAREDTVERLAQYGRWLGIAFQVVDDVLDVDGDPAVLGKAVGVDARCAIATLPALVSREKARDLAEEFVVRARAELTGLRPVWLRRTLGELAAFVLRRRS